MYSSWNYAPYSDYFPTCSGYFYSNPCFNNESFHFCTTCRICSIFWLPFNTADKICRGIGLIMKKVSLKYGQQSVTKDKRQAVSLPLMSSMNWFLLPQMTEPLQNRMEVWNMYHGLQFAKIINLLLMALNILRNSKLFGIIQMEILFTLTVVSARYLIRISDIRLFCQWHFLLFPERKKSLRLDFLI